MPLLSPFVWRTMPPHKKHTKWCYQSWNRKLCNSSFPIDENHQSFVVNSLVVRNSPSVFVRKIKLLLRRSFRIPFCGGGYRVRSKLPHLSDAHFKRTLQAGLYRFGTDVFTADTFRLRRSGADAFSRQDVLTPKLFSAKVLAPKISGVKKLLSYKRSNELLFVLYTKTWLPSLGY